MSETRLLSPDQAAVYLGLGSRWAVYRLIGNGQIPVIRLAGKLRIDREDLNLLIVRLKTKGTAMANPERRKVVLSMPPALAPLRRRNSRTPVTVPVTRSDSDA